MDDEATTTATARLPGLDLELRHRWLPDEGGEEIVIRLRAVPSLEAFGRLMETANPFALWMEVARLAWVPWLAAAEAMRAASGPLALLPKPGPQPKR
jgi:hypothetical protein